MEAIHTYTAASVRSYGLCSLQETHSYISVLLAHVSLCRDSHKTVGSSVLTPLPLSLKDEHHVVQE